MRSWVAGLKDKLVAFTQRSVALDHTWDKERVALEVGRVEANSWVDDLALELL